MPIVEKVSKKESAEFPDQDIDFYYFDPKDESGKNARDLIVEYIKKQYGDDHVSLVGNIVEYSAKSSIRDLCQVYDIEAKESIPITKQYDYSLTLQQNIENNANIEHFFNKHDYLIEKVEAMEGLVSAYSVHAGGLVMTDKKYPIRRYCALQKKPSDNDLATMWPKDYLQSLGLVKFDFLGLKMVGILHETKKEIGISPYEEFPEEKEVFDYIVMKSLNKNVFQFDSNVGKQAFTNLLPMNISELSNASGIIRVLGSEEGREMYESYKENVTEYQTGDKDFWLEKLYEEFESEKNFKICSEILKETYGILIYQEQLAEIVEKLSNNKKSFTDGNFLRKKLEKHGKKYGFIDSIQGDKIKLKKWHKNFMELMNEFLLPYLGEDGPDSKNKKIQDFLNFKLDSNDHLPVPEKGIIRWMIVSSAYLFSKLHSTAYTIMSYQTMYLKYHHPVEYWKNSINILSDNFEKGVDLMNAMRAETDIKIIRPDINKSSYYIKKTKNGNLVFGLGLAKGLGKSAREIINTRKIDGKYKSIKEFVERVNRRVVNKKAIKVLIQVNAFKEFGDIKEVYEEFKNCGVDLDFIDFNKEALSEEEHKILGINISFMTKIAKEAMSMRSITTLEDGETDKFAIRIKENQDKVTRFDKPYVLHICEDLNSRATFRIYNWQSDKIKLKAGKSYKLTLSKNNGFIGFPFRRR